MREGLNKLLFDVHTLSKRFDYKNSANPLTDHIHTMSQRLDVNFKTQTSLNLVQNSYTLNNDLLSLNSEEGTFWQFRDPLHSQFANLDPNISDLINLGFQGHVTIRDYEVNYYSFWEFIGQLGGFYEILELLGTFFIGFYNENLLNINLLE